MRFWLAAVAGLALTSGAGAEDVEDSGRWQTESFTDSMSDKTEAHAFVQSADGRLTLMCTTGDEYYIVAVQPRAYLGGGPTRYTRYELKDAYIRFDDQPPRKERWKYLDTFATPNSAKSMMSIATEILSSSRVRLRLVDYRGQFIDLDFGTAGAREAMMKAARDCGHPI